MRARFLYWWDEIRSSYWFVPTLMMPAALLLALGSMRLDSVVDDRLLSEISWIYTGGPEGAREMMSTIAGSMITVTGVVFSITIVTLTLASSQFGPRVLSNFMRDRPNQVVLGTFVATFVYCLLVLRSVRADAPGEPGFVPHIAVTVGTLLALLSLGVLVYFIHHVSVSIQAPSIIASIAQDLHAGIGRLERVEEDQAPATEPAPNLPERFMMEAIAVRADEAGYLDTVDLAGLLALSVQHDLVVRLEYRPGHFVVHGDTLALVWPAQRAEEFRRRVRDSFVLGARRGFRQDVEFPVHQLVEVAVRALSPGINDPFTALTCIDRLGSALCHLARHRLPAPHRLDDAGRLRLAWRDPITFHGVVDRCFDQIRQNAAQHAVVYLRLLEVINIVIGCVHDEEQLGPLLHQARMIRSHARGNLPAPEDREAVETRYAAVLEAAERRKDR